MFSPPRSPILRPPLHLVAQAFDEDPDATLTAQGHGAVHGEGLDDATWRMSVDDFTQQSATSDVPQPLAPSPVVPPMVAAPAMPRRMPSNYRMPEPMASAPAHGDPAAQGVAAGTGNYYAAGLNGVRHGDLEDGRMGGPPVQPAPPSDDGQPAERRCCTPRACRIGVIVGVVVALALAGGGIAAYEVLHKRGHNGNNSGKVPVTETSYVPTVISTVVPEVTTITSNGVPLVFTTASTSDVTSSVPIVFTTTVPKTATPTSTSTTSNVSSTSSSTSSSSQASSTSSSTQASSTSSSTSSSTKASSTSSSSTKSSSSSTSSSAATSSTTSGTTAAPSTVRVTQTLTSTVTQQGGATVTVSAPVTVTSTNVVPYTLVTCNPAAANKEHLNGGAAAVTQTVFLTETATVSQTNAATVTVGDTTTVVVPVSSAVATETIGVCIP